MKTSRILIPLLWIGCASAPSVESVENREGVYTVTFLPAIKQSSEWLEQTLDFSVGNTTLRKIAYKGTEIPFTDASTQLPNRLLRVDGRAYSFVRQGHDKMVTATFDVLNGEEVIASTVVQQKVEETDSSREVFHLVIAKEKLNADTTIRITMRTKDW